MMTYNLGLEAVLTTFFLLFLFFFFLGGGGGGVVHVKLKPATRDTLDIEISLVAS